MRDIAASIKNIAADLSSDLMVVIKDDDPKKRDALTARIEKFLYKIRNNEEMTTFTHRRDEPGKTTLMIGVDNHEEKDAIIKAIWTRAEKEAGEDIQIWTKELKDMKTASLDCNLLNSLVDMGAIPSPSMKLAAPIRWQAVFFIGPAGSGKSFIKTKKYLKHLDFKEVDPDEIKKTHPNYDPDDPFATHAWSKEVAQSQLKKLMRDGSGSPVIVDGTGTASDEVIRDMKLAEDNGYRTYLVYVYVPFEISIWRNRNRERFVPEDVIMEQSVKISKNYKRLKSIADKAKIILNYEKAEQKLAKEDIELYPAPQPSRPPRPGDPNYGNMDKVASELIKISRELLD